ncbi:phage tail protein [Salmonella enterica]|nr:phage tail protein [Salmonella enterica]
MTITDYTIGDVYLTEDQLQELLNTRLAFKKWPETENWPNVPLPEVPEWIINELVKKGLGTPQWTYNG